MLALQFFAAVTAILPCQEAMVTEPPAVLRVMTLNLWQEGTSVEGGFDKIVDVIGAANADILAITEVRNYGGKDLHERLLAALEKKGIRYHGRFGGGDVGLLSRFPIKGVELLDESAGAATRSIVAYELELPNERTMFAACAHLDYRHYAAYLPRGYSAETFKIIDEDRDGVPDPVTDLEAIHRADAASRRDEAILGFIQWAKAHQNDDVVLLGDFNEPSHLDWTEETKDTQDHGGLVIPWKNSVRLAKAGFVDTYRACAPDPLTHPGSTWPSVAHGKETTAWIPLADERDRIDFIYSRSKSIRPVLACVVGPRELHVKGAVLDPQTSDLVVLHEMPWPTDHRGVLVEFEYVVK